MMQNFGVAVALVGSGLVLTGCGHSNGNANPDDNTNLVPSLDKITKTVQRVIDLEAAKYNTSLQVGFQNTEGSFGVAAGVDDAITGKLMTTDTMIPLGSITKAFTATAVMKFAEEGKLDLDAPAHIYADPMLEAQNGSTLLSLWGNETINEVTVRQLLHMSGGLRDYDDTETFLRAVYLPDEDEDPFEHLWRVDKKFLCAPGDCMAYSSIGYLILGFVLQNASGVSHWTELDQKSFMTQAQREKWQHMTFSGLGKCSQNPGISHQWVAGSMLGQSDHIARFYDLRENSCLNGWTFGNIASNGEAIAGFFYDLMNGHILSNSSLEQMQQFEKIGGLFSYGLGLIRHSGSDSADDYWIGHPGVDYGSQTHLAGFYPEHGFSLTILHNSVQGTNCSSPATLSQDDTKAEDAVLNAILKLYQSQALMRSTSKSRYRSPWPTRKSIGALLATAPQNDGGDYRCDYAEDMRFDFETDGSCHLLNGAPVPDEHYRITNVTDSSFVVMAWIGECSGPALANLTLPFSSCQPLSMPVGRYLATASSTHDKQAGVVTTRYYLAGGITQGCQWHRTYGDTSSLQTVVQATSVFVV